MALIVEDGSGIPGANAYIDITYVDGYFLGERLIKWNTLNQDDRESAIINATSYVDIAFEWRGNRNTLEQGLSWPRSGVSFDRFPVEGIPVQVKKSTAESVWLVIEGEELFSSDSDVEISSEQVDIIKTTYREMASDGKKAASRFDVLNKLLRGFYKDDIVSISGGGVTSARVKRV
jgi:hypothetical protein